MIFTIADPSILIVIEIGIIVPVPPVFFDILAKTVYFIVTIFFIVYFIVTVILLLFFYFLLLLINKSWIELQPFPPCVLLTLSAASWTSFLWSWLLLDQSGQRPGAGVAPSP